MPTAPEIITLHPTFIIGPTLITERNSTPEGMAKIMTRNIPGIPNLVLPAVDVRDVARAHYLAFEKEGINGERFLISHKSISLQEISGYLDGEFRQYGYRV